MNAPIPMPTTPENAWVSGSRATTRHSDRTSAGTRAAMMLGRSSSVIA
jgi:hypothetical protein